MSVPRRHHIVLTGLLAAILGMGQAVVAPATAAAAPQTQQAPQNATITIDTYLTTHPGGVQISPNDIAYNGGALIVTLRRDASIAAGPDCPTGWYCFYEGTNYTYPRGRLSTCGWQNLGNWNWGNRIESVHYNMARGSVAFLNETGSTDTVLFTAGTSRRTVADVNPHRNKADYVSRSNC